MHQVILGDSRHMTDVADRAVHLVVTSPPYFNLKAYPTHQDQLGNLGAYELFLDELGSSPPPRPYVCRQACRGRNAYSEL